MTFNVNDKVRVKLTKYGSHILKVRYNEITKKYPYLIESTLPVVDDEGYSTFQLWDLMATFGEYLHNGGRLPFETNILIP